MNPFTAVRVTSLASAIALAMVATAAHANDPILMSSSASLSNLSYQLIDLDPTDGVTPWVQFSVNGTLDPGYYSGSPNAVSFALPTNSFLPAQSTTATAVNGSAQATAGPSQLQTASSVSLSQVTPIRSPMTSVGNGATGALSSLTDPETGTPVTPAITLSANTLLIIRGSASVQMTRDLSFLQTALDASTADWMNVTAYQNAGVSVSLSHQGTSADGASSSSTYSDFNVYPPIDASLNVTLYRGGDPSQLPLTLNYSTSATPFAVQWANTGSSSATADLSVTAGSSTYLEAVPTYISQPPIPEPSTYVLTGLGLMAAARVARRLRRQPTAGLAG
ncbi:PEP-CTERM sorting domain-containing protein [Aquabacterium sp.]|uniref:PEP-CTERM sorting domain-containing protein n=1 Tax=Aquabacterium sp. TaxID=1872578 RepID=UPI0035B132D0